MPTLFVMLLLLVGFVLSLDNAFAGVEYYVVPDFSKINAQVINSALSQAFFSLSLGMGIMITYGSYLSSKDAISGSAKMVALTDTMVAFVAGLLILPAVFSFNPETNTETLSDSSVGLIFTFLPQIFLALQDGIGYLGASIVAASFFLLVFFAAITSLVSIAEVPVASVMQARSVSRKKGLLIVGLAILFLAILASMSFGIMGWVTEFTQYAGQSKSLFDVLVDVFYDTILPFNGFLICIFVIYRWKSQGFNGEISRGDSRYLGSWFERYVTFSVATVIPLILLMVFLNTVAVKFFGISLFL
jgi:NSS family neurotransmitter:Na+ symporter